MKLRQRIPGTKLLAVVGGTGSRAEEQGIANRKYGIQTS